MNIRISIAILSIGALALASCTQPKGGMKDANLETTQDSLAYAWGVAMSDNMAKNDIKDLDVDIMIAGLQDHWDDDSAKISVEDAQNIMRREMMARQKAAEEEAKAEGKRFLDENRQKEGIQETESGLQYKVLQEGDGKSPDASDQVTVHYHGTLIDGTVFDSSVDRGQPATFRLNQVIPGWTEGVQLMKEGAKYRFFIPQNLAYGPRGQGDIEPFSTLIFDVELIEVKEMEQQKQPQGRPQIRQR
ncbi:FKBP-type peptidyl-prolyl cis-trans isomerase [Halocola ammonii]